MAGLNVLITNNTLAPRAGTELYVRDLALELQRRGHSPAARLRRRLLRAPLLGPLARSLARKLSR